MPRRFIPMSSVDAAFKKMGYSLAQTTQGMRCYSDGLPLSEVCFDASEWITREDLEAPLEDAGVNLEVFYANLEAI